MLPPAASSPRWSFSPTWSSRGGWRRTGPGSWAPFSPARRSSPPAWGGGIAIPHADLPEIEAPRLALALFPSGVDFDALDEEPVHVVFLLLGTPRTPGLHMKILARIARLSKDPGFRPGLCACRSGDEATAFLARLETRHWEGP